MRRELDMVGYHGRGGHSAMADPVVGSEKVTIDRPKRKKCEGSGKLGISALVEDRLYVDCGECGRAVPAKGLDWITNTTPIHYRSVTATSEEAAR